MSGQEASALKRQPLLDFIHILWPCLSHLIFLIFNPSPFRDQFGQLPFTHESSNLHFLMQHKYKSW